MTVMPPINPNDDDAMKMLMEDLNNKGLAYPPELLEWVKKQPKKNLHPNS